MLKMIAENSISKMCLNALWLYAQEIYKHRFFTPVLSKSMKMSFFRLSVCPDISESVTHFLRRQVIVHITKNIHWEVTPVHFAAGLLIFPLSLSLSAEKEQFLP